MGLDHPDNPSVSNLSLQDLRAKIHALKLIDLTKYSLMQEKERDELTWAIQDLVGPEKLLELSNSPEGLEDLKQRIGDIMQTLAYFQKRDLSAKVNYEARTGLTPRYKVLNWEKNMINQKSAQLDVVKSLVKLSAKLDGDNIKLSKDILSLASNMHKNTEIKEEFILKVQQDLEKSGMTKEAQGLRDWWNTRKENRNINKQRQQNLQDDSKQKKQMISYLIGAEKKISMIPTYLQYVVDTMSEFHTHFQSPYTDKIKETVSGLSENISGLQSSIASTKEKFTQDVFKWTQDSAYQKEEQPAAPSAPAAEAPVAEEPAASADSDNVYNETSPGTQLHNERGQFKKKTPPVDSTVNQGKRPAMPPEVIDQAVQRGQREKQKAAEQRAKAQQKAKAQQRANYERAMKGFSFDDTATTAFNLSRTLNGRNN